MVRAAAHALRAILPNALYATADIEVVFPTGGSLEQIALVAAFASHVCVFVGRIQHPA
jgi:hypothetical protein